MSVPPHGLIQAPCLSEEERACFSRQSHSWDKLPGCLPGPVGNLFSLFTKQLQSSSVLALCRGPISNASPLKTWGFITISQMVQRKRICQQCKRPGFDPWVGKIPWRREWQPTPVSLPGEFHRQRSLMGYSPWVLKESRHEWATNTFNFTSFFQSVGKNPSLSPWGACKWESQFLGKLIGSLGVPRERGVWNPQGGRKDKLFCLSLHSLGLYNNNVSCLRTVFGFNLLLS